MPPTMVVKILNTHHIPAHGMCSLLRDSFGKEVGKRKWCETFAGPLVRRLSRSGGLSFMFSKEMLIFLCFIVCFVCALCVLFFGAPEHKKKTKNTIHTPKKQNTQFIPQKNTKKQNTQFIPKKTQFIRQKHKHKKDTNHTKKTTSNTTKKNRKNNTIQSTKKAQHNHNSYQKNTVHTTKKAQKNRSHFPFCFRCNFCFFFYFFSAFGKLLLLKHFKLASPAELQPPPQPASPRPLVHQPPSAPSRPCPGPAQQPRPFMCIVHTHSIVLLSAL